MRILLCGYDGSMGQVFSSLYKVSAGFSLKEKEETYPTYSKLSEIKESIDIIVDFSHKSMSKEILDFALEKELPLVIATTNLDDEFHQAIDEASFKIPILQSGNFSKGMNVTARIIKELTKLLNDFDLEIEEKHHRYKEDAPSGSAKMLLEAAKEVRTDLEPIYDRQAQDKKRDKNEVGMHSLRGGTVVGEHSMFFLGEDETVEIKHTALSKNIFARGAYDAVEYLMKQSKGRFDYEDVILND